MKARLIGLSCCTLFTLTLFLASLVPGLATKADAQQPAPQAAPAAKEKEHKLTWEEQTELRITELQSNLHITAEQQKAFDDLAQVMRDNAKSVREIYEKWQKEAASGLSAIESMKGHYTMALERAEAMKRLMPVFETLYNTLDAEQKKIADKDFAHQGRPDRLINKDRNKQQ